jgi:hypothetical protein
MQPAPHSARVGDLAATPLRDLGLTIASTPLEGVLRDFLKELEAAALTRVRPDFYFSTEWGVPFGTVSIAIPFYLARLDLTHLHAERVGLVEGAHPADVLRYLRHEMGHVVNYAYLLYERADWTAAFGSIDRPYVEEYRPVPFSRDFVRHLPGWYAQKHPDEDWAETFAVWLTPGRDWRRDYAGWPALAKLELCDRLLAEVRSRDPAVTLTERDEDVSTVATPLGEHYRALPGEDEPLPPGLDGALLTIFEDAARPEAGPRRPASALIRGLQRDLPASVFRWTGHFPERTSALLRRLAERADALGQVYPEGGEQAAAVAVTALVTALAMNHIHHGSYMPAKG